jgi:hypothetical protein
MRWSMAWATGTVRRFTPRSWPCALASVRAPRLRPAPWSASYVRPWCVHHNWETFTFLCAMEAMKSGVCFPSLDMLDASIRGAMEAPHVVERAALILAMGREHAPAVQVAA